MENNWCIKLDDENRDVVINYFEKQYVANYKGVIGHYYGHYNGGCFGDVEPFGTEITFEEFKTKILGEGYKSEILSTSTNNPPINKFLDELDKDTKEVPGTPSYYDNSKGTIYKIAQDRNWNAYVFEAVKRLDRAEKKGEFISDIDKTIKVLELYKLEQGHKFQNQIEQLNKYSYG